MPRSGTFRAFKNSPLNKDVWFALIPLILPILGKEKSLNFFEIQGFTSFFFLKKWCHQESNRGHKDFQSFALKTFKSLAYGSTFKGNQLSYCTLTVT